MGELVRPLRSALMWGALIDVGNQELMLAMAQGTLLWRRRCASDTSPVVLWSRVSRFAEMASETSTEDACASRRGCQEHQGRRPRRDGGTLICENAWLKRAEDAEF